MNPLPCVLFAIVLGDADWFELLQLITSVDVASEC
jgi:hypothetical protein